MIGDEGRGRGEEGGEGGRGGGRESGEGWCSDQ